MKAAVFALATGILGFAFGCAHEFLYAPVGPGAGGGPAARYPIPPAAPQGEAYVTSFGFTDLDAGPGGPGTLLHARLAVSNGSPFMWTVDGREQVLAVAGQPPQAPTFLNTDAGSGPIYEIPPSQARVFDLYFAVPPPLDRPASVPGFALDWRISAGGQPVAARTAFQRFEGAAGSYEPYPPYVAVGLGFGVGWWYGPFFPYHHHHPPVIRGYYYPPARARGGPWRGVPPGGPGLRGTPPAAAPGWRGTPPGGSGLRGTPPGGNSVRAAPAPMASPPRAAPSRGGPRGGGGGRGRGR